MTTALAPTRGIDHLDATQVIVRRQVEQVQRAWRGLDPGGLRASFAAGVAPVLISAISTGQIDAAALATPYVADVLADEHASTQPPAVVPSAFAGVTTTGLPLAALADLLFVRLLADIGAGMSTTDALLTGLRRALTYTATEITDAGRTATQTQLIADTRVAGYERVVKLPACDRCIILTGRLYRYSQGFRRHPRCDCTMTPVTRQQWRDANLDNHPRALFDSMTAREQNSRFGAGNAAAIRAGADLSQVVNARKGAMPVAGRWITTQGTSSRGLAGTRLGQLRAQPGHRYRMSQLSRPTAGQVITDFSGASRPELIAALRRYGYLL
ncbi:VG15 protein [Amycolatopsis sp. NPDC003861]